MSNTNLKSAKCMITRKIRVLIDIPRSDKVEYFAAYQKLNDWQEIAFKASNIIASHLFIQENVKDFTYFNENVIVKLTKANFDNDGILNTSRQNSIYRLLSKKFKNELPSTIASCINQRVNKYFRKEKSEYYTGQRSLRSYKHDLPVPLPSDCINQLSYDERIKNFRFLLFKDVRYSVPLRTVLGRDLSNNKVIIERCITGEYILCESNYRIEMKKIYLYLSILQPTKSNLLDTENKVQAKLSFLVPIILTFKDKQYLLGDKDSFVYKRKAIQKALCRTKELMKFNKGGKGRNKKTKGIEKFKKSEKNFVESYAHYISYELVKFCLKNNSGVLELKEITQSIEEARKNPFVLRNWSYGNLLKKIAYKCKINNIELVVT